MGVVGRIGLTSLVFVVLALCRPYTPQWAGASHGGAAVAAASEIPPCNSFIYCYGPLLHTVQMLKIFPDSKTFVDMPMRKHPDIVYEAFLQLPSNPSAEEVLAFVNEYFAPAGSDMQTWTPDDWVSDPEFLSRISDPTLREFARDVHSRWKVLGRQFNQSSSCSECFSSFILPFPFIVPGGRFREAYYWDTYWIIDGLLIGGMHETVRGMLRNFFVFVDVLGFVPNGGRIYYSSRSQPPMLTRMVDLFVKTTGDTDFLVEALPFLDKEYRFWMSQRAVAVNVDKKPHILNVYRVPTNVPRPESYHEDVTLAEQVAESERPALYSELAAGAESGWDYTARWFANQSAFMTIHTSDIIPVDLNSMLYDVETTLARFHATLGDSEAEKFYLAAATQRAEAMHALMWNSTAGYWKDYDMRAGRHVDGIFLSSLLPLWANSFDEASLGEGALQRIHDLLLQELERFPLCGLPSSHLPTGQQWDYPNAWPPLQYFAVRALERLPGGDVTARKLARTWLACNWCGWSATGGTGEGVMYEKYDAERRGVPGGGGEYGVQEGFGWTNGVVLRFLMDYSVGDELLSCSVAI